MCCCDVGFELGIECLSLLVCARDEFGFCSCLAIFCLKCYSDVHQKWEVVCVDASLHVAVYVAYGVDPCVVGKEVIDGFKCCTIVRWSVACCFV